MPSRRYTGGETLYYILLPGQGGTHGVAEFLVGHGVIIFYRHLPFHAFGNTAERHKHIRRCTRINSQREDCRGSGSLKFLAESHPAYRQW